VRQHDAAALAVLGRTFHAAVGPNFSSAIADWHEAPVTKHRTRHAARGTKHGKLPIKQLFDTLV
jgi:hypothetical protein